MTSLSPYNVVAYVIHADGEHDMKTFDGVASGLREAIKSHGEKMDRRTVSLFGLEKEVETKVSDIDAELESIQWTVNDIADKRVSIEVYIR